MWWEKNRSLFEAEDDHQPSFAIVWIYRLSLRGGPMHVRDVRVRTFCSANLFNHVVVPSILFFVRLSRNDEIFVA